MLRHRGTSPGLRARSGQRSLRLVGAASGRDTRAECSRDAPLDPSGVPCHSVHTPVGIPIILGASEKIRRTGGTFRTQCPRCNGSVKMYDAVKHTNVSAFLAISLWDGEDPVIQCGECLAVFSEENAAALRASAVETPPSRIGAVFSSLLPGRSEPPPSGRVPSRVSVPTPRRTAIDEAAIDAELAAMKKRLGK